MSKQSPKTKILSLIEKRRQEGLPAELELTYTICEEIDILHDRIDHVTALMELF